MEIKHREMTPSVRVGVGSCVPHGAVRVAMSRYTAMLARAHRDDE